MAPHFSSPPPPHPPTLDSEPFSRPRPRPPRSPSQQAQIRLQNRRREYLARYPSYFECSEHELADPLLYDTLIRRYQTPAEREAEGRARGYARVLEGSLMRGEERLARLAGGGSRPGRPESMLRRRTSGAGTASASGVSPRAALGGVDETLPPPETKTEGHAQWTHFLRERFVRGGDEDFDYAAVDGNDELDVVERVEREEAWFDEETPRWDLEEEEEEEGCGDEARDGSGDVDMDREGEDGEGEEGRMARRKEKELQGETGVQDF